MTTSCECGERLEKETIDDDIPASRPQVLEITATDRRHRIRGRRESGARGTRTNGKDTTARGDVLDVRKVAGVLFAHATRATLTDFVCHRHRLSLSLEFDFAGVIPRR